jgi:DNA-binding beta-propeller fold protein YncE
VDGKSGNINAAIPVEALENVAVNPFTNRVYAAQDLFPGKVTVIDGKTNQVIADVTGGGDLSFDVGVDPSHNLFYSTDQFGTLSVFDGKTNTLTATVALPGQPTGIAVDPLAHKIYVSDIADSAVDIVDGKTNTLIGTVAVGSSPTYSAINPANGLLYVGNTGQSQNYTPSSETLSVIKTR